MLLEYKKPRFGPNEAHGTARHGVRPGLAATFRLLHGALASFAACLGLEKTSSLSFSFGRSPTPTEPLGVRKRKCGILDHVALVF